MDNDARGTSLLRRIEELAARAADEDQAPPEGPVLAAALTGLRAELGGLRADLGTLRADVSAVRSGVDTSAGKLTGAMSATQAETENLGRRHDELAAKVDNLADIVGEVRSVLPQLRTALADSPTVATAVQAAVSQLEDNLEAKIETLAGDLRRTLSAGMSQAAAGSRAAETAWTEARAANEERMAAVEDTLDELAERLEAATRDTATSTDEQLRRVEAKVDELAATVLPEAFEAQTQWAQEVRAALSEIATAVDRSFGSLGESLTQAIGLGAEAGRTHTEEVAAGLSRSLDEAVAALDQRATMARDASAAANADLRGFLASFQSATEERLEQVRAALAGGLSEARAGLIEELRSTIESLESANAGSRRLVEEEVSSLRGDLADALEEVRDRIATTVTRADESIAGALDSQRQTFDEVVRELRSTVLDRLEESTATVATGLDQLRGGVTSAARAGEVTTAQVTSFAESMAGLEHVVGEMHADWDRRTDAAIDLVAQAGHAAVGEFRDEVREVIEDLRRSVDVGTQEVAGSKDLVVTATQRLVSAGEALLGYLARRDQVLEGERDRILHEMLDEFAQGLSAKERRGMGERVGAALDRRRDARDAERFRQGAPTPTVDLPEVPADLTALAEPLPPPKKPKPPKQQGAAKTSAQTAPAKTPPAKAPPAKTVTKAASKPAVKTASKAAGKAAGTSAPRAGAKTTPRPAGKAATKAAVRTATKTAGKSTAKTSGTAAAGKKAPAAKTAVAKAAPVASAAPAKAAPATTPAAAEPADQTSPANSGKPIPASAPARKKSVTRAAKTVESPAPITAAEPAEAPSPDQANTTEPLDGEGTTRV